MDFRKSKNSKEDKNRKNNGFFLALEKLFSGISERPKGIIEERYGVKSGKPKTLEEIGKEYRITRERVRQIIREIIKKLKKIKGEIIADVDEKVEFTLKKKNGIMKEEELLSDKLEKKEKGALKFFLELSNEVSFHEISGELEKSWAISDFDMNEWHKVIETVKKILNKLNQPLSGQEILENIKKEGDLKIDQEKLFNYLDVSSKIKKGNFGKWGLKDWPEINPKGTREKIYLVLKEVEKPTHFREIAGLIDIYKLGKKKKTHPQTVHNELIRDRRFVLVGRGIYALADWGYQKGTVKEVLESILIKNSQPMEKDEIVNKILGVRKVKKSTILINLNNFFQKVGKNQYSVRK